jgi:glutathione S-transferase
VVTVERRKPPLADEATRRLAVPLRVIESHLAARAYLAGARFTVADICVASVLAWVRDSSQLMANAPQTAAWLKRCLDRPAHQQVRSLA